MLDLQKPEFIYFERKIRPWDDAKIHVSSEAVFRGLNVFEGLKAYWQPDDSLGVVALRKHYERFARSATLLNMPFDYSWEEFEDAVHSIIGALVQKENNIWVRATLYMIEGHWGEGQRTDLCLQAFQSPKARPEPMELGISTWKRASDNMLPARIKTSTNYQVARLARIEGRGRGYSEMVLLNASDRVAETGGSCIVLARDGKIVTPPVTEAALESITLDIVEELARRNGMDFERRPVNRTELHIADEIAIVGTLAEMTRITAVDGYEMTGRTQLLSELADLYYEAVSNGHEVAELSCRRYD